MLRIVRAITTLAAALTTRRRKQIHVDALRCVFGERATHRKELIVRVRENGQ